jgi:hypothetical protein
MVNRTFLPAADASRFSSLCLCLPMQLGAGFVCFSPMVDGRVAGSALYSLETETRAQSDCSSSTGSRDIGGSAAEVAHRCGRGQGETETCLTKGPRVRIYMRGRDPRRLVCNSRGSRGEENNPTSPRGPGVRRTRKLRSRDWGSAWQGSPTSRCAEQPMRAQLSPWARSPGREGVQPQARRNWVKAPILGPHAVSGRKCEVWPCGVEVKWARWCSLSPSKQVSFIFSFLFLVSFKFSNFSSNSKSDSSFCFKFKSYSNPSVSYNSYYFRYYYLLSFHYFILDLSDLHFLFSFLFYIFIYHLMSN